MPPLEGEVAERSEVGGVCTSIERLVDRCKKTPQSARSGCQLSQRESRGRFAPGMHSTGRSIFPPVSEQSRHRAGQGTNVSVQCS